MPQCLCIQYWSFLNTELSYFTMYALCIGGSTLFTPSSFQSDVFSPSSHPFPQVLPFFPLCFPPLNMGCYVPPQCSQMPCSSAQCVDWAMQIPPLFVAGHIFKNRKIYTICRSMDIYLFPGTNNPEEKRENWIFVSLKLKISKFWPKSAQYYIQSHLRWHSIHRVWLIICPWVPNSIDTGPSLMALY